MKKETKTERLKRAYKDLRVGKTIEFTSDDGTHKCKCWVSPYKSFIMYESFGSSATRITLSDLRWIAKTIAQCTTYEYKVI